MCIYAKDIVLVFNYNGKVVPGASSGLGKKMAERYVPKGDELIVAVIFPIILSAFFFTDLFAMLMSIALPPEKPGCEKSQLGFSIQID